MSKVLDDELVAYARLAFRQFQLGPRSLERFRRTEPDLCAAVDIYSNGGCMKDQLEAAILTEANGETIGDFLGMPAAVAALYEKLFFTVREVACSPGLIVSSVIRPAFHQGAAGGDGGVMKLVAYFLGWDVFRNFVMVGTLPGEQQEELEGIIRAELTKEGVASVLRRGSGAPARGRTMGHPLRAFGGELATCGRTAEQLQGQEEEDLAKQILGACSFYKRSTGPPPIGSVESRAIEGLQPREEPSPAPPGEQPGDGDDKEAPEKGGEQDVRE